MKKKFSKALAGLFCKKEKPITITDVQQAIDIDEALSQNITLRELTKSDYASRHGIDNTPSIEVVRNLRHLALHILQPVRDYFGKPVVSSSGFRCLELNRAVGSKDDSQHVLGEASDFEVLGVDNLALAIYIRDNLEFDQLILEFYVPGDPKSGWIHCSFRRDGNNRRQVLTAQLVDGRVHYSHGIEDAA